MDTDKIIQRIQFKPNGFGGKMSLFYKKDRYRNYAKENEVRNAIQKMITEMGYNPSILSVENG